MYGGILRPRILITDQILSYFRYTGTLKTSAYLRAAITLRRKEALKVCRERIRAIPARRCLIGALAVSTSGDSQPHLFNSNFLSLLLLFELHSQAQEISIAWSMLRASMVVCCKL